MSQPQSRIEKLYKPLAVFSLLLSGAMATIHVLALAGRVIVPVTLVFPLGSFIFLSHVIVVGGCIGDRAGARIADPREQLSMWDLVKAIPWRWKLPMAVLLYIYAPWVVIVKTMKQSAQGAADEAAQVLFLSLIAMLFALFHFLSLWYALPRKQEILSARHDSEKR